MPEQDANDTLALATEIAVGWLANPNTRAGAEDVPAFLASINATLANLAAPQPADQPPQQYTPAVSVRKSLASPDHIISMIDGKPYKTLRRHLARHGLTPDQYRERYGLKADYPMTSESYSQVRRDMAKQIGLGRKGGGKDAGAGGEEAEQASGAADQAKPARAPRRRKAESAAE